MQGKSKGSCAYHVTFALMEFPTIALRILTARGLSRH